MRGSAPVSPVADSDDTGEIDFTPRAISSDVVDCSSEAATICPTIDPVSCEPEERSNHRDASLWSTTTQPPARRTGGGL